MRQFYKFYMLCFLLLILYVYYYYYSISYLMFCILFWFLFLFYFHLYYQVGFNLVKTRSIDSVLLFIFLCVTTYSRPFIKPDLWLLNNFLSPHCNFYFPVLSYFYFLFNFFHCTEMLLPHVSFTCFTLFYVLC